MVLGETPVNISASEIGKSIIGNLPPEITAKFGFLINILEAIGIVVLIYIVFLIIKAFFSVRMNERIKKISNNVEEINQKLDSLVKKKMPKPSKK